MKTTIYAQLLRAIETGDVRPGDCVLYRFGGFSPVQRLICRVQARALSDLGIPRRPETQGIARFTHAGLVRDDLCTVEMTTPRARIYPWGKRLKGVAEIAIIRPVSIRDDDSMFRGKGFKKLRDATVQACEDVLHRVTYPHRELFLYWLWSWGWRKLGHGHGVDAVFRDRKRNVCSGSVIDWWRRANIDLGLQGLDRYREVWYPARLLADCELSEPRFRVVARFAPIHQPKESAE